MLFRVRTGPRRDTVTISIRWWAYPVVMMQAAWRVSRWRYRPLALAWALFAGLRESARWLRGKR